MKEKFGGLRFYVNSGEKRSDPPAILAAQGESFHTCEIGAAQELMAELSNEHIPAVRERIHERH